MADAEFGYISPPPDGPGAANEYMDAEPTARVVSGVPVKVQRVVDRVVEAALDALRAALTDGTAKSRVLDSAGAAITEGNRLPVDIGANVGTIQAEYRSPISEVNVPPATLDPGAVWVGEWEDVRDYTAIVGTALATSTQPTGTVVLRVTAEFSEQIDKGILFATSQDVPANIAGRFIFTTNGGRFFRVRATVLGTAPVGIRSELKFAFGTPAIAQLANAAQTTDLNLSSLVQSHLKGRIFSGASAGAWAPLGTDGTGSLFTRDSRGYDHTITARMLEKKPTTGYRLWLHDNATTNLGVGTILAEALVATATATAGWRGIFVPQAGGQITERTAFAWDSRLTGWVVE